MANHRNEGIKCQHKKQSTNEGKRDWNLKCLYMWWYIAYIAIYKSSKDVDDKCQQIKKMKNIRIYRNENVVVQWKAKPTQRQNNPLWIAKEKKQTRNHFDIILVSNAKAQIESQRE